MPTVAGNGFEEMGQFARQLAELTPCRNDSLSDLALDLLEQPRPRPPGEKSAIISLSQSSQRSYVSLARKLKPSASLESP